MSKKNSSVNLKNGFKEFKDLSNQIIKKNKNGSVLSTDNYYKTGLISKLLPKFVEGFFDRSISFNNKLFKKDFDLNFKAINLKIKSLLRETRDEIKSKGSQVVEINTNGNFVKKIRDFLQENQNINFMLEVVSLRDSKTVEPIVVEINIVKIAS